MSIRARLNHGTKVNGQIHETFRASTASHTDLSLVSIENILQVYSNSSNNNGPEAKTSRGQFNEDVMEDIFAS